MKIYLATIIASFYAVSIRLSVFFLDDLLPMMSLSLLALAPFVIGFVTVYLTNTKKVKTTASAFFIPWISCLVILMVTIFFNLEGTICWVMIFPFFAVLAGLGGIVAHQIKKKRFRKNQGEELDKEINDSLNVSFFMIIPLVLAFFEGEKCLTPEHKFVKTEKIIALPKEEVWQKITATQKHQSPETGSFFTELLGFPKFKNSYSEPFALGAKRMANYERGLFFEEIVQDFKTNKYLVWQVNTYPTKIPKNVMDEHILVGGKYFDILEDRYELVEISENKTLVKLQTEYYVNTPFNWYSSIWASFLLDEILNTELEKLQK